MRLRCQIDAPNLVRLGACLFWQSRAELPRGPVGLDEQNAELELALAHIWRVLMAQRTVRSGIECEE